MLVQNEVENPLSTIGYIEPGHGMRGKQQWLTSDENLSDMYHTFAGKNEIILWCYSPLPTSAHTGKRPRSELRRTPSPERRCSKAPRSTNYSHHQKKMDELDVIYQELAEKHEKAYSPEQLRAWAYLLQMNKHDSYDEPPNKPFFRNKNSHKKDETNKAECSSQLPTASTVSISPGKHVSMQGQLIEQISRLHELL